MNEANSYKPPRRSKFKCEWTRLILESRPTRSKSLRGFMNEANFGHLPRKNLSNANVDKAGFREYLEGANFKRLL